MSEIVTGRILRELAAEMLLPDCGLMEGCGICAQCIAKAEERARADRELTTRLNKRERRRREAGALVIDPLFAALVRCETRLEGEMARATARKDVEAAQEILADLEPVKLARFLMQEGGLTREQMAAEIVKVHPSSIVGLAVRLNDGGLLPI